MREGEPLVEVSTDKINYEVESPASGTVGRALGNDGDEFACGDVIGTIALAGEMDTPAPSGPRIGRTRRDEHRPRRSRERTSSADARVVGAAAANAQRPRNGSRVIASPAARRLAREHGVALGGVRGTGPRGRITMSDVHTLRQARVTTGVRAADTCARWARRVSP